MNLKHTFPKRNAINRNIIEAAKIVAEYYIDIEEDPFVNGHFEKKFCAEFTKFMSGGYCDLVCSGTVSIFIAIKSLELKKGSYVLVSPITDPGTLNAIICNGLLPILIDTEKNTYNISARTIELAINKNKKKDISAITVVHCCGEVVQMEDVLKLAKLHKFKIIEDCSQAHGASINGKKVGTFGEISGFSLMSRKTIAVNGAAGLVYTKDWKLYGKALAISDRGYPILDENFDQRDPSTCLFPSLNYNIDEISSALGLYSLQNISNTISRRRKFLTKLKESLNTVSKTLTIHYEVKNSSPFIIPVYYNNRRKDNVYTIAQKLKDFNIPLNPRYNYLSYNWKYLNKYLNNSIPPTNAIDNINNSFVLYVNENYGQKEVEYIIDVVKKLDL